MPESNAQPLFTLVESTQPRFASAQIDYESYALSYRDAAKKVIDSSGGLMGSVSAFPALFLYRHAIEIYIKAILLNFGNGIATKDTIVRVRSHNIQGQLSDLNKVCARAGLSISQELTRIVKEWMDLDPDGVSLRYPEQKVKNSRGKDKRDNSEPTFQRKIFGNDLPFDIRRFAEAAEAVLEELSELSSDLHSGMINEVIRFEGISN